MFRKALRLGATAALVAGLTGGGTTGLTAQMDVNPYIAGMDVRSGERLFERQCSRCHGIGATGGDDGPDLTTGELRHASTDAGLFNVVYNGIPNTEMPGLRRGRTDQAVWQLVAYLRSLTGGIRVEVVGSPSSGAQLYRGKGNCAGCHMIHGEGGRHGPDLSTIGNRRSPEQLMSDLLEPDERVQARWWRMRVTHADGTRVQGLRMNEGTYSVRILGADDELWSFLKRDLRESERIEASSMPSYAGTFTDGEREDLVAYLYGLIRGDR